MKIAIYSPYLNTAGGGEKYMLTIAEILSKNLEVDFLLGTHLYNLDIEQIKQKISRLHGLDLSLVKFIKSPIGQGSFFLKRIWFLKNYDCFFYLTDGSIFFSSAKKNIVHFQVPFENVENRGFVGKIKLNSWTQAIYNSFFTKNIVEKSWPIKGKVIYPPVSVDIFVPLNKKKQILSVGRFFGFLKDKKQTLLIDTFKVLFDSGKVKGWSLHLAGGSGEGDQKYIEELKQQAQGYNIFFYPSASLDGLKKLYGESLIYWHAAGFGEKDPKKYEHFGISTVESMSAGCIPIVINLGGQKEIVEDGITGFVWNSINELKAKTYQVIKNSNIINNKISLRAQERARDFSKDKFIKEIKQLIYE